MFATGSLDGTVTISAAPEISSAKIYKAEIGGYLRRTLPQSSDLKDIAESASALSIEHPEESRPRLSLVLDDDSIDARGLGTVG